MVRVLVPTGALGLGYEAAALERGIAARPDIIAIDGGSTDSGPHYLGTGTSKYSRATTKVHWQRLIEERARAGVPLVIGTAGTSGADSAVDWLVDITREIARETGQRLRVATVKSGQSPEAMAAACSAGRITPLPAAPDVTPETFRSCSNIVALAGAEQVQAALATGADIVIAGRTTDTAIIAALPLARGCHPGAAWHGAKIAECGALATTKSLSGTLLVEFDKEGFTVEPMGEGARATPQTVSAHMLYENSDPFVLYEPGGYLDVTDAHYRSLDDRRVRVTGSRWVPSDRYTVKLEGAARIGAQTVSIALIRDPHYVACIRDWCADIHRICVAEAAGRGLTGFSIEMRIIGLDATLGAADQMARAGTEVGVMAIVTAADQAQANEIAKMLNPYLLHHQIDPDMPWPTFAFPFSPPEMPRGDVYAFLLNHVLELDDPMSAFRLSVEEVGP